MQLGHIFNEVFFMVPAGSASDTHVIKGIFGAKTAVYTITKSKL